MDLKRVTVHTLREMRQHGLGQQERAAPVQVDQPVPVVQRLLPERHVDGQRRVIDQDVDLAVRGGRGVRERVWACRR